MGKLSKGSFYLKQNVINGLNSVLTRFYLSYFRLAFSGEIVKLRRSQVLLQMKKMMMTPHRKLLCRDETTPDVQCYCLFLGFYLCLSIHYFITDDFVGRFSTIQLPKLLQFLRTKANDCLGILSNEACCKFLISNKKL